MKQKQIALPELESPLTDFLSADELFLLGFLQGFDRKSNDLLAQDEDDDAFY